MRTVRAAGATGGALLAGLTVPSVAAAHGVSARSDLPLPSWLFGWGAAVVLVVSFVALAVLWREPRLAAGHERRLASIPTTVEVVCGAVGVLAFAGLVYTGLEGEQSPATNLLTTFVFVVFWVGIPVLSVLLGDMFSLFSPWRAIGRGVGWLASRTGGGNLPTALPYPDRLGYLPAVLGLLAFGWLELVWRNGSQPSMLAVLALAYCAAQLVGMSLYGVRAWTTRADAFGVYFAMFARISPLAWSDGSVALRRPLAALGEIRNERGLVALLCVAIGITTFDGGSRGPLWVDIAPTMQGWFTGLGLRPADALQIVFTIGLLASVGVVAIVYSLGLAGMRNATLGARDGLAGRFASSLVPIAFAYILAHYVSFLVFQGQALGYLLSNPLGRPLADGDGGLLGTAQWSIDYTVLSANAIWYIQVVALVVGHVAALVVAHDRALTTFSDLRTATRSQYWMLTVMVAFTALGLWLLSAANG